MKRFALTPLVLAFALSSALAQDKTIAITVSAGKTDHKSVPICVPLSLPKAMADYNYAVVSTKNETHEGQLTAPGITTEQIAPSANGLVRRDLHFIVPVLHKGETDTLSVKLLRDNSSPDPNSFYWRDHKGEYAELIYSKLGGAMQRPVLRYMHKAYDDSNKEIRDKTYKVFHHLYDPAGKRLVTNGGQAGPDLPEDPKKLLFPHHRGLMIGFNRCSYGPGFKNKADTWHCQKDDHQSHEGFLQTEVGAVLARHRVAVDWHGAKKEVFVRESRELTVYNVPGGTLVEFATRLKAAAGPVKLDGDPQHAGFQFRAHNDVAAKTKSQTYYLRPDGEGKLGETRNWDPKTKKGPVDLPWNALSFVLAGQRYTVAYLDQPKNPRPSRHSERDYGRFGCYFEHELTQERPLVLNYRIWLQNGEMTGPEVAAHSASFVSPPQVTVK
jgi:hypothetical protein